MAEATTTAIPDALHGPYAGLDLDALVDWPVVRAWLYWGMFWLMFAPTVGAYISRDVQFPGLSWRASAADIRPAAPRARQWRHHGRVLGLFIGNAITWCRDYAACGLRSVATACWSPGCGTCSWPRALVASRSATIMVSRRVSCLCWQRFRFFSAPPSPPCSF